MNNHEIDQIKQRLTRLENQNQALTQHLINAFKTIEHLSLMVPNQETGVYDRQFCRNQVEALQTLKPMNRNRY